MEVTTIAALSTHMANANVRQEVNIKMLRNMMDQMEQAGEQMAKLLQPASIPAVPVGVNISDTGIDIRL